MQMARATETCKPSHLMSGKLSLLKYKASSCVEYFAARHYHFKPPQTARPFPPAPGILSWALKNKQTDDLAEDCQLKRSRRAGKDRQM